MKANKDMEVYLTPLGNVLSKNYSLGLFCVPLS